MHRQTLAVLLLTVAIICWPVAPAFSYTLQFTSGNPPVQLRWPTNVITVALSPSLQSPPSNIKAGSDVVGAVRRALARWSQAADVEFRIVTSNNDAVSPSIAGNNESLITVATVNRNEFTTTPDRPGRSRVFFDPNTGTVSEVDIAINPIQDFSTDGTPGTYDLEATFVHEIGHLLGLEHSGIIGATMQPQQGRNGFFNLPAQTLRTLSDDDRAGARSLYGPRAGLGAITGTVRNQTNPVFGAHVWVEDVATGRVRGGNVTLPDGTYRIEALPPGQYRLMVEPLDEPVLASEIASRAGVYAGLQTQQFIFRTQEISNSIEVSANETETQDFNFSIPTQPILNPRFIGVEPFTGNQQLSTVPVPLVPGQRTRVLVGGDNVQQVNDNAISVTSSFITIDRASGIDRFTITGPNGPVQVLGFFVDVAATAPPGDYSLRLVLSTTGEVAYVTGGLTVDLPNGTTEDSANPIDEAQFFVSQHYRDFLHREPDPSGFAFWVSQITSCGSDTACRELRRINVSAAFFLSGEFQQTGFLVYQMYQASFGRRVSGEVPVRFDEFLSDQQRVGQGVVVGEGEWQRQLDENKQAFAEEFVQRSEFTARYPQTLSPAQFVDALNQNTGGSLTQGERDALVTQLSGNQTAAGRASVLRAVAENAAFAQRERSRAFVLMQYFGYLRRNPSDAPEATLDFTGFNFWLAKLESFGGDYIRAEMVRAFITSSEYRQRFGRP